MLRLGIALQVWTADRRDRGATAVEYALIIAGIAGVIGFTVWALRDVITDLFDQTCNNVIEESYGSTDDCAPPATT